MTTATMESPESRARHDDAFALFGRLLGYPGTDFDGDLVRAQDTIGSPPLLAFCDAIRALSQDEREELYTSTFDVTPRCVPYVSIHLFGEENFKRGEFMAALHSQYELVGFDSLGELPDHIAVLLQYAAGLDDPARCELVEFCLLGPLVKITSALPEDHPYRHVLDAVGEMLRDTYPGIQAALSPVEQMRQHGICPTVSDGCHCVPVTAAIIDGPEDTEQIQTHATPATPGASASLSSSFPSQP